ncbi:MAG: hypothetical protein SFU86_23870 [Pirellulaceae bacterium]|nr:hypothetical protein [Pirellulaceae bacterium]
MSSILRISLWASPLLLLAGVARAQTTSDPASQATAAHLVVRVSGDMLNSLVGDLQFERQATVRDNILGTAVLGVAQIAGQPRVELTPSPDRATFRIVFRGTVNAQTIGYNGPAIIHSRSETRFAAARQIVFDPARGFFALDPQVEARTQIFTDQIGSTRGGLLGRIIRRRAARLELARRGEATEIARQKNSQRILAAFDEVTRERLARLNSQPQLRALALVAMRHLGQQDPTYAARTTADYVQIAARFGAGGAEFESLAATVASPTLVEFWLHHSLTAERLRAALAEVQSQGEPGDFLKAILPLGAAAADVEQRARDVVETLAQQAIEVHEAGEWRIVTMPRSAKAAALAAIRPAVRPATGTTSRQRTWTSGPFTADAEFVALEGSVVRLRRPSGTGTRILFHQLSSADQAWIRTHLASR